MKRFTVTNSITGKQFRFEGEIGEAQPSWGKPERWLTSEALALEGLTPDAALETREVDGIDGPKTEYKIAAEYTIVVEDMAAEIAQAEAKKRELELNEGIRKAAKEGLKNDIKNIQDPIVKAALTKIEIILSKWN